MSSTSAPTPPNRPTSLHGNEEQLAERRTLRDYYIMVRERLWIALPIALLVAAGFAYWRVSETKMYRATASMQFERPERVVQSEQVIDQSVRSEIDLNTNLKLLESGRIHAMVVQSLTPEEARILQRPYLEDLQPGEQPPPAAAVIDRPSVQSIRNSFIISVTAENRDPDGAALIANRYADQFVRYLIENSGGRNEFAVDYLKSRAEELRKESEAAENRLQEYKRRHNLVSLNDSVDIVADRLRSINTALTTVRLERINLDVMIKQIEGMQAAGGNVLETAYISGYGNIPALKVQLADLRKQQSILSERYLERHPKMIDLANAIDVIELQIQRQIQQAVADLRAQIARVSASETSLASEYRGAEQDQLRLGELSVEFKSLENQAQAAKSYYVQILDRFNQTTTTGNLDKVPVKILDRASPPQFPYKPNVRNIAKMSIGLFLVVFAAVAVGLSFLDDRIKSAWDVEGFIGVHLLGIIPDLADIPDSEKHSLVTSNKTSPGSEAFLSVYSAVKIQSKLDFPKSILVTSTIPGEGKTMISCNLAGSFARHGKRVLLIDCDMRRPMLHRHFRQTNEAGLVAWFDAGSKIANDPLQDPALGIIRVEENLYLLRSGGRSKSPTELLENPVFGHFLESLKHHFDLVVVDSPPMGAVTDALLISAHTDEVIYVCRFNRAYRKHIRLYVKQLRESKNELLGIVLNGLSPRRIEYYSNYRYYRSYKKYYGAQS